MCLLRLVGARYRKSKAEHEDHGGGEGKVKR
jgi:hypothetical protein